MTKRTKKKPVVLKLKLKWHIDTELFTGNFNLVADLLTEAPDLNIRNYAARK